LPVNEILRANAVSFRYPQNGRGFGPFSLSVQQGECVLISGLSGSGKSTLARCLVGIIPHLYHGDFQGEVWLDRLRAAQEPLWALAEKAGFVFQNPALQILAPTVEEEILFGLENLGISREAMRDRLEEALERFGLASFRGRSPQTLSGGEQQKLALAAGFARRPGLFLLDEPLSMLDTTSAIDLTCQLADLKRAGVPSVIFEHREAYLHAIPGLRKITLESPEPAPVHELEDEEKEPQPIQTLVIDRLQVERGKKQILRGLSLTLKSGQITALIGPNGVGKTTLLRALAGFQSYQGEIQVAERHEKPHFGMVFQNPDVQLFNATVRDEILYQVNSPDLGWYRWLISMLDLERYEATPPLLLSEGEKRRVALATVLMRRPGSGILLDEPALGLDSSHQAVLLRLLRALSRMGLFVLFSTHDLELAAQADHLILMGSDGIAAQGPVAETMGNDAAWATIGLVRPAWIKGPR
jgi:energy-coupling factor transport system ATP-binding protein